MLSKFSVKKPYTVMVAVIIVLILGIISFMNLQTDLLPDIDLPYVMIITSYPGASPEEIELTITRPIEQVVATTNNIKNVSSISRENSSMVMLEFNNDVNMDSAIIEINGSLDLIKGLWNDSVGSPMIMRLNPEMLPVMVASVDVEGMDVIEISKLVSEKVIPELESVDGVASVTGVGLLEEKIEVVISKDKIDSLNKKIFGNIDSQLSEAEDKLLEAKKEIENSKAQLVELEKIGQGNAAAKAQLIESEKEVNKNLEQLEIQREEAYKKASLEGVVSTSMISGILKAQNFSMPAGYVTESGTDYLVKVGNKIKDIKEIKGLLLFDTGIEEVGKVYLKDVADIENKNNSKDIYAKINGNDAVMLTFQKQSGFSTAKVSEKIREKMDKVTSENEGSSFIPLMDQGVYIDIVVSSVLKNILYGGILAILILLVFLRNIQPTIIIALSIPISIVFAIAMMYFSGVSINIISLAGLALGVGMLVDNSIVVIENIYRLRGEGKSIIDAAIEGAKEVSGAIIASTLTTACVFLPIVFTKGISKQLFTDMGLTISYSLFASLIVALTLVPAMASNMLKNTKEKKNNVYNKLMDGYEKILNWTLKYKIVVLGFVIALLGLSTYYTISMGTSFIPEMEAPQMSLTLKMPKESTYEDTITMSDTVMDRIMDIEGIETVGAFQSQNMAMGMGGSGGGNSSGTMSMYLILDENKNISNTKVENEIRKLTETLEVEISINSSNMNMSALGGSGIEVLVKGRELDTLSKIAVDVSRIVEETEGTEEVSSGTDENATEIRIIVDKEKSMEKGLTVAQIFSSVNSNISKGKSATVLSGATKDYPIIVLDGEDQFIKRTDLAELLIESSNKGQETQVRLGDIALISEEKGLSAIRRQSQERFISVTATIDAEHNIGLVSRDLESKLKDYKLPEGYSIELSGENEMINDSLRDLIYMLLLAVVLIYLIMVAQFQSLLSPFIVMFTIPLAFTGGLLALVITGNDISLISMLGFLVLSGIVVNNGIVFVDYTNQLRDRGLSVKEALVLAGKTRMRPILMTAITTILGLSTLSIGIGVGSEMLQPLAIVSIGGLIYATILTLFVVPVMYDLLNKNQKHKRLIEEDK